MQARQLAAQAGQPLHETAVREVEQTLHAAMADPDVARDWADGRLTRAMSAAVDLTGTTSPLTRASGTRTTPPPKGRQTARSRGGTKDNAAERDRHEREQRERQEWIAQARRQAETDAREAAAREDTAAAARQALAAAEADLAQAEADIERLTGELRRAEAAQHDARLARQEAGQRWQEADAAARRARQRAADSAARAEEAGTA